MQSLAVKYRPKTFDDVSEQQAIKLILREQIETETNQNCYLFTGAAGTGKTTCARIFASEINKGKGLPIEIDAASNNGVDNVRDIIDNAKFKAIDSEYKVYILDECFHPNTLIDTPTGKRMISTIKKGDTVFNLTGKATVAQVYCNSVLTSSLIYVIINGSPMITTKNHLFFTNDGWVEAQYLTEGEIIYDYKTMSNLQKNVSNIPKYKCKNLWKRLRLSTNKTTGIERSTEGIIQKKSEGICLSNMQYSNQNTKLRQKNCVQSPMCNETYINENSATEQNTGNLCNLWSSILKKEIKSKSDVFSELQTQINSPIYRGKEMSRASKRTNAGQQSNVKPRNNSKDAKNKGKERDITSVERGSWGEWLLYEAPDSFEGNVDRGLDIRISGSDKSNKSIQDIPKQLQSRPRISKFENSDRGGWSRSQYEISTIIRRKENQMSEQFRVDRVEVYKPGYNDQLFRSYFDNKQFDAGIVKMYDLEVAGHPSYFANNALVHNCHSLSSGAWNAMLKIIEEPPAKTIFIFCTTDPQKIPATILSRVQRFDFQRLSYKAIVDRLKEIINLENNNGEKIESNIEALEYISRLAEGGMRDAITMLDKCLSLSPTLTVETVVKALGTVNYDFMFSLTDVIYEKKKKEVVLKIEELHRSGADLKQFIKQYILFILDLCKYDLLGNFDYIQIPSTFSEKLSNIKQEEFYFYTELLDEVIRISNDIKWETNPKPIIESVFILLCRGENK